MLFRSIYAAPAAYGYAGEGELEAAGAEYIAENVEDLGLFLLEGKM